MNDKRGMSRWGIGPLFVALGLAIAVAGGAVSWIYRDLFIIRLPSWPFFVTGGPACIAGLLLWIPAGISIDRCVWEGVLAKEGIYGIVRHPIYAGIFFVLTGCFIASRSFLLMAAAPLLYVILRLLILREERTVRDIFKEAYGEYEKRVKPIFPKLSLLRGAFFYPMETVRFSEELTVIRTGDVDLFLYTDGETYICIDAGYPRAGTAGKMANLEIQASQVSAVFLTHTDHDHVGELDLFSGATVYLGENEEPLINGGRKRLPPIYRNKPLSRGYSLVRGGETVRVGNIDVKAIETPGHTVGHLAYLVDGRYLFTGDAVVIQNGEIKPFYRLLSMRHGKTRETADAIRKMKNVEYICTAHTGIIGREK